MNNIQDTEVILFDLGGVLVDFIGLREVGRYLPDNPSLPDVRSRWIASEAISKFETGNLSKSKFVVQFIKEWNLPLEAEEFERLFVSWIKGPLPGMTELLSQLRNKFQLACLSNTNHLHWDFMLNDCDLKNLLHHHYASHLIGDIKPCRAAFDFVCSDLQVTPEKVIFFDDGFENVEGALAMGMNAFQVDGPKAIGRKLRELGILN